MKSKKILFVIHALGYGGAGKMIVYLANHMAKCGYKTVIYVEEQQGQHYPVDPSIEVVQETEFFKNYYIRHFQQIFQLRRRVAEINPDIVVSFQTNQNALSVLATRGRRIPVIISERGDPYQYNDIIAKLKTSVINKAEGAVFQTKRASEYYGEALQKRSKVIYNPCTVSYIERPAWSERDDEVAFVARFDIQQKRQDLMVKAFARITSKFPSYKLCFYGVGGDQESIEKLVGELGIRSQVVFKGLTKDIPNAIKKSKLFVLSSDYEGLPNALIEAMAVGLPCISTDCSPGGAAELIQSGKNGIIVSCGDEKLLASAIEQALSDPIGSDVMGQEAQKIIEKLAPNKIYAQWEEYIRNVLESIK